MKSYIRLNKDIDCNYLCNRISKILNELIVNKENVANKILSIEIKEIIEEIPLIYNLEYKPNITMD